MAKMMFLNVPVTDLAASVRFYQAIGCIKNAQFSGDQAAMMVWPETITFQLLSQGEFGTFTPKRIADAHETCEVLFALSRDSREEVDSIAEAAAGATGKPDIRDPQDLGFMYMRSFEDPDGHGFEAVWMNMEAAQAGRSSATCRNGMNPLLPRPQHVRHGREQGVTQCHATSSPLWRSLPTPPGSWVRMAGLCSRSSQAWRSWRLLQASPPAVAIR